MKNYQTIFDNWKFFVKKILDVYPGADIYLKGGAVIGIYLLKTIYTKDFDNLYPTFKELELINDFDFEIISEKLRNDYFYYEFGKEHGIVLNGKNKNMKHIASTLRIMRSINSNLFEMNILEKEEYPELPITNMKIFLSSDNYDKFFTLFENIYYDTLDKSHLEFLNDVNIYIPECDINGMFDIKFDADIILSDTLINIIYNTTLDKNSQICLYYLIKNPTNLSRLRWKNISKSNKIKNFLCNNDDNKIPLFLLNDELILNLVDHFISNLSYITNEIYMIYAMEIDHLTNEINQLENIMIINECKYDLAGIGGSPASVLIFLNDFKSDNKLIISSPRISKLLLQKDIGKQTEKLISDVELLQIKCHKYDIVFHDDMVYNINEYPKLKHKAEVERNILKIKITTIYETMFEKLDNIFVGINIIRWKNNIKMYRNLDDKSALEYITNIFKFHNMIKIKTNLGNNIINVKNISTNPIWQLFHELSRT
jgi:hypothetical protein